MPNDTGSSDTEDDELIEISSTQPSPYVPSRDLELHRLLAEVGALVAPSPGGTLFCQAIPVRVRDPSSDCDLERLLVIRVAVRDGRTLLIELYDDDEPLSLIRKEITSVDFEAIREEQQLLVDFATFPQTVVQLLHSCGISREEDQQPLPRLVALLVLENKQSATTTAPSALSRRRTATKEEMMIVVGDNNNAAVCQQPLPPRAEFHRWSLQGQSLPAIHDLPVGSGVRRHYNTETFDTATLFLTETNQYRELNHLKLTFERSSDRDCAFHLTNRLGHTKLYSLSLEHELCRVDAHRRHWAHLFQEMHSKATKLIRNLKATHAAKVAEYEEQQKKLQAETNTRVAEATVAATTALEETRKKAHEEMSTADATIAELRSRIRDLEEHIHELLRGKSLALDNVNRLETETRGASERVTALTTELMQLRSERDTLSQALQRIQEVEKNTAAEAAEYKAKATLTEEQIKEQVQSAIEKAQNALREREKKLKTALASSDEEIEKGNKIIAKLQSAVRKERERAECLATSKAEAERAKESLQQRQTELLDEITSLKNVVTELTQTRDIQQARINALEKRLTQTTIESVINSAPPPLLLQQPHSLGPHQQPHQQPQTSVAHAWSTSQNGNLIVRPVSSGATTRDRPKEETGMLFTTRPTTCPAAAAGSITPINEYWGNNDCSKARTHSNEIKRAPSNEGTKRINQDVLYIRSNRKRSTSSSRLCGPSVESVELKVPINAGEDDENAAVPPNRPGEFVVQDLGTLSFGR